MRFSRRSLRSFQSDLPVEFSAVTAGGHFTGRDLMETQRNRDLDKVAGTLAFRFH
jgi:hypothetical protein